MKETINKKTSQGKLRIGQRLDRTTAPMIKSEPVAVTLAPLDPAQPYPQPEPSGTTVITTNSYKNEIVTNSYKMEPFEGDITLTNKKRNK